MSSRKYEHTVSRETVGLYRCSNKSVRAYCFIACFFWCKGGARIYIQWSKSFFYKKACQQWFLLV